MVIFILGNFAMRRKLYGDAVVGAENIAMIDIAKVHGLSAKFTGSGGALVCMRSDGQGWYVPTYIHTYLHTYILYVYRIELVASRSSMLYRMRLSSPQP